MPTTSSSPTSGCPPGPAPTQPWPCPWAIALVLALILVSALAVVGWASLAVTKWSSGWRLASGAALSQFEQQSGKSGFEVSSGLNWDRYAVIQLYRPAGGYASVIVVKTHDQWALANVYTDGMSDAAHFDQDDVNGEPGCLSLARKPYPAISP